MANQIADSDSDNWQDVDSLSEYSLCSDESIDTNICEQVEGLATNKTSNLNTFQSGDDSKRIEKKTLDVEIREAEAGSSETTKSVNPFTVEIDEAVKVIQSRVVAAVVNALEAAVATNTTNIKNNLEIEVALSNILRTGGEGESSRGKIMRTSLDECKLAARLAEETSEDVRRVVAAGYDLMETILSTIEVLQSHVVAFMEKSLEASEGGTEHDLADADFYHFMSSKYEAAVKALSSKAEKVQAALDYAEKAAVKCLSFAELSQEITEEALEKSVETKFKTCWWKNRAEAAMVVLLKQECSILKTMREIWINVRNDLDYENRAHGIPEEDDTEENARQQQCQNRKFMTRVAHAVSMCTGVSLLGITSLFEKGSDSFKAILILGLVTTGWTTVYWCHQFYQWRKSLKTKETLIETEPRDGFLDNVDGCLKSIRSRLETFNDILQLDPELDTQSLETVRIDEFFQ